MLDQLIEILEFIFDVKIKGAYYDEKGFFVKIAGEEGFKRLELKKVKK